MPPATSDRAGGSAPPGRAADRRGRGPRHRARPRSRRRRRRSGPPARGRRIVGRFEVDAVVARFTGCRVDPGRAVVMLREQDVPRDGHRRPLGRAGKGGAAIEALGLCGAVEVDAERALEKDDHAPIVATRNDEGPGRLSGPPGDRQQPPADHPTRPMAASLRTGRAVGSGPGRRSVGRTGQGLCKASIMVHSLHPGGQAGAAATRSYEPETAARPASVSQ